jgi:hypothetical protein
MAGEIPPSGRIRRGITPPTERDGQEGYLPPMD